MLNCSQELEAKAITKKSWKIPTSRNCLKDSLVKPTIWSSGLTGVREQSHKDLDSGSTDPVVQHVSKTKFLNVHKLRGDEIEADVKACPTNSS